ncbi:DUF6624 domain-containing protein [Streptomyces pseudogriseolus]|uniref:Transcriptional regulator n=1 Tax=Streptomyces pseudogriseolus TaxID=36817 RepID=A0ABQ2T9N5_STREZ|nr:DUF6624 domain-containing protein [Streptomyces rubiginosus]GGS54299.1 hypothetical protein GCM10010285_37350 [Streptomyces rubiginosus]
MTASQPLRPDLARELIALADQSAPHWSRRACNQLDAVHLGQGRHADHANAKRLGRILAEENWPGHRLVGADAARAAWQIALHADDQPDFQRTAARLLYRAAQQGDAPLKHWAHLYDRSLINSGQPQEFGTQYHLDRDGLRACPIRDPASLPARRESVGLSSADTALSTLLERLATPGARSPDSGTVLLAAMAGAA